ncbi:MAG TPA: HEAT repeat domain-containing protein, partial [Vicinamibacteria bacterium]
AERGSAAALDRSTRDILADRLGVSDPQEILYALRVFEVGRSQATHPAVRGLLAHPSAEVREKAIAISNAAGDTGVRATVEQLLRDPHLGVRTEALLYLARHAHIDPLARIEELGDFADSSLRTAIVAYLAHPGPSENLEAAEVLLDQMVADTGPDGARVRSEAARLMGRLTDPFPRQLLQLIADEDPGVASEAVRAVGQLRSLRFVLPLLGRIGEPELTEVIAEALAGFGDAVVGALRDHLADPSVPAPIRREIPRILGRIGTRAAAKVLGEVLLEADTTLRFRAIQALNKVYEARPDVERDPQMVETVLAAEILGHYRSYQILGALRDALPEDEAVSHAPREAMAQEVERIFRLLKLLYPRHDLHSACFGVQSEDPVMHDNALEFLDNILRPQLRAVLVPLLDSGVSVAERVRLARRMVGVPIDGPAQAAKALLQSDDAWLQSCGAYAVGVLGIPELEGQLDRCLQHADPLLREAARQAKLRLSERSRAAARPPVL